MDIRLKQLSYSSLLTLHSCPRKYELKKLGSVKDTDELDPMSYESITFAFGHTVGLGVAEVFMGTPEDEIIFKMFQCWEADLLAENPKQSKSFWLAVIAMQKLIAMRAQGFLSDWEVVQYDSKPAVELSFIINFPTGFVYRGYVDAVLRNKSTGSVMVLECKTSSAYELSAADYKNSSQAIGYSIVLDRIYPGLSGYDVQYLIYRTKQMLFEPMKFSKDFVHRAQWIQELSLDINQIQTYHASELYPMRGESCRSYNRDCEYFGVCNLKNEHITRKLTDEMKQEIHKENAKYQISISIQELIDTQIEKEL